MSKVKVVLLNEDAYGRADSGGGNIFRRGEVELYSPELGYFITHNYSTVGNDLYEIEYKVDEEDKKHLKVVAEINIDLPIIETCKCCGQLLTPTRKDE